MDTYASSPLFSGMTEREIEQCLACAKAAFVGYDKEAFVFHQQDRPDRLYVLAEGSIVVGSDTISGRRTITAAFSRPGELFGEVFVFLKKSAYDHYAQAAAPSRVLEIPRTFLTHACGMNCGCHERLIENMMGILAQKAYYLNQKLQILSCATLRQKLARVLLRAMSPGGTAALLMNREELADFVGAARPSVSRELMSMQADGLITVHNKVVRVLEPEKLRDLF